VTPNSPAAVAVVVRRLLSLAVSVSLILVLAPTAEASSHRHVWRCRPNRPNVVVANKQAEVFEVGYTFEGNFYPLHFDGCAYGSQRPIMLGFALMGGGSGGAVGSDHYTLAGTTVAYAQDRLEGPGNNSESWAVVVVNLRSGKRLRDVSTGAPPCPHSPQLSGVGPVDSLVLKADSAVAWIATDVQKACPQPAETREVHALDSSGERLLATGTDIAPHSLKLAGGTIYWRQGGRSFSTSLH
jgi:hypothetical protein